MLKQHALGLTFFLLLGFISPLHGKTLVFNFGKSSVGNQMNSAQVFSQDKLDGFDLGSHIYAKLEDNAFFATAPIYFSTSLVEGNYQVDITFGSAKTHSVNTLKAESRRIMLNQLPLAKGESKTLRFMLNVRTPKIDESDTIDIKEREKYYLNWDNKLTLEFSEQTAVQQIKISPANKVITLFLAGDSTVTDQDVAPWASWGQLITQYFDDKVVIANYAESGASLTSFKQSKRLDKILSLIKPGDYLFIEFAHNDEKLKGPGIGPWQSYQQNLIEFINSSRSMGGIPVLLTPTQRRFFNDDGTLKPTHGDFPAAMREVANNFHVPLIDVSKLTAQMFQAWGDELSRKAFVQYPANTFPNQSKKLADNTHFNTFGANEIALAVVQGIRDSNLKLSNHILPSVLPYDATKPNHIENWTLPMSTRFETIKPDGN